MAAIDDIQLSEQPISPFVAYSPRFALAPDGSAVYAVTETSYELLRLHPQTLEVEGRGPPVGDFRLAPDGSALYAQLRTAEPGRGIALPLVRLDPLTLAVQAQGRAVHSYVVAPDGAAVYISGDSGVERFDPITLRVLARGPRAWVSVDTMVFRPGCDECYVTAFSGGDQLIRLDRWSLEEKARSVGYDLDGPAITGAAIPASSGHLYVVTERVNGLLRLDAEELAVIATGPSIAMWPSLPNHWHAVTFPTNVDALFVNAVLGFQSCALVRLDPSTLAPLQKGMKLGGTPITLNPAGTSLYVTAESNELLHLDPVTLEIRARGPQVYGPLAISPGGTWVYANGVGDTLQVTYCLDAQTLEVVDRRYRLSSIIFSPDGRFLYGRSGAVPQARITREPLPNA